MALDGAFLYAVKTELMPLIGSRVDRIHQPSREEIIITMRTRQGAKKLYISANAASARVHVTNKDVDNPQTPPMFCMLLRKRLGSGRLVNIRQDGLERVLFLDFECVNELGDTVTIVLACEIMGRCSNLVVIGPDGRVIDSIKRVDEEMSRERSVLPGMRYVMPPRRERLNMLTVSPEEIKQRISDSEPSELSKALIRIFEGVSPILAREWVFRAGGGQELKTNITGEPLERLVAAVISAREKLLRGECRFTVVSTPDGELKDISFVEITQFGDLMKTQEFSTASELLDHFYFQRDSAARTKQRANDLFRLLINLTERTSRRINIQREELAACGNKEELKLCGDLVSANIYRINKGDTVAEVENFYKEGSPVVKIPLDARKTPSQNAQHFYSEYRKLVTAEEKLAERIEKGEEELSYLDSVFDALTRAVSENDVIQLREELREQGYIRSTGKKVKPPKALPPVEYRSGEGFTILVGRNNMQNDRLSLKLAEKNDIWLHTQSITGSHVLILSDGQTPPDSTIEEAAVIAAVNSKGRDSSIVPVDYCLARYVKKTPGAKPGKVIFSNYKTAFVKPDKELEQRLKVSAK